MISKEEWQSAVREMTDEGRQRHEPPTVEEVEKLFNGELSGAEADRVRELLSYYPELARVMTTPLPDDPELTMSEEEVEAELARFRRRFQPPAPPVDIAQRRTAPTLALAAGIVIAAALGAIAYRQFGRASGPALTRIVFADGERGGTSRGPQIQPPILLNTETEYDLQPVYRPPHSYREYRLELLDMNGAAPRTVWSRSGVERRANGAYEVRLSTKGMQPGRYRLVLYGVDDETPVQIAVYTIRLDAP